MLKWLARRILGWELTEIYMKGVKDGVNQRHWDKESAMWMVEPYEEA
tara:strand:+ start:326 stop:466 length:141 start_codon:yes stop_codon:yes gene_type:complete